MLTGAYVAESRGLEDPGWLCKLPGRLMAHSWSWNPKVPVPEVAKHSEARTLATLGGVDDNSFIPGKGPSSPVDLSTK